MHHQYGALVRRRQARNRCSVVLQDQRAERVLRLSDATDADVLN